MWPLRFIDRKGISMIYDGRYVRYCEKGMFAEDVFNTMFSEFMTNPNNVNGDFHEIELLLTKYLWSVMPPRLLARFMIAMSVCGKNFVWN